LPAPFKKHALGFVVVDDASEKPLGLYASHSADETAGSLRHWVVEPDRRKNSLADGSAMSSSCTRHWLASDAASHTAWASACVTCPVHAAVQGASGEGGEGGGGEGGGDGPEGAHPRTLFHPFSDTS